MGNQKSASSSVSTSLWIKKAKIFKILNKNKNIEATTATATATTTSSSAWVTTARSRMGKKARNCAKKSNGDTNNLHHFNWTNFKSSSFKHGVDDTRTEVVEKLPIKVCSNNEETRAKVTAAVVESMKREEKRMCIRSHDGQAAVTKAFKESVPQTVLKDIEKEGGMGAK